MIKLLLPCRYLVIIFFLLFLTCFSLLFSIFPPGCADPAQASRPHRPHPRAGCAPNFPPAGQRLHPDVALPAVPALPPLRPPRRAHVRGLPGSLLPEVGLQGTGPQSDHSGTPDLRGNGLPGQRSRLHAAEQRLLRAESHWLGSSFGFWAALRLSVFLPLGQETFWAAPPTAGPRVWLLRETERGKQTREKKATVQLVRDQQLHFDECNLEREKKHKSWRSTSTLSNYRLLLVCVSGVCVFICCYKLQVVSSRTQMPCFYSHLH